MNGRGRSTIVASAPGKLILIGEHAAVYGSPAVAVALDLRCHVTIVPRAGQLVILDLPDINRRIVSTWEELLLFAQRARDQWAAYVDQPTPDTFALLRGTDPEHMAKIVAGEVARQRAPSTCLGVEITLRSAVPVGAGFGSSASVAVSLAAGLLASQGVSPSYQSISDIALAAERQQHGQPSGIDHHTVLHGGFVRTIRDPAGALQVASLDGVASTGVQGFLTRCSVYHTGPSAEPTGAVVAAIRPYVESAGQELLDRMKRVIAEWLVSWHTGGVTLNHVIDSVRRYESCLEALGVVPSPVQEAIRAVEREGGAAKVCGAGSLVGPGAGALLVVWPGATPDPLPAPLRCYPRIEASLGGPGVYWESR